MSDGSVSKEISDILVWIAKHDGTCRERYDAILKGLKDCREEIGELKDDLKTSRAESKLADTVLGRRVARAEKSITSIHLKLAYFAGAAAFGSFAGGMIFQLIFKG